MHAALVVLALVSAAGETETLKVAVPPLATAGVDAERGAFFTEAFAQALRVPGMSVVTARDINTLLGIERERQLLGCAADSASCMTELANALGTEAVVVGEVAQLSGRFRANIRILRVRDGAAQVARTIEASSDLNLLEELEQAAREMAVSLLVATGRGVRPVAVRPRWPWAVTGAGALLAVGGAVAFAVGKGGASEISAATRQAPITAARAEALAARGATLEPVGVALLSVGAAAAVAGVGLGVFLPRAAPPAMLVPLGGGGGIVFWRTEW